MDIKKVVLVDYEAGDWMGVYVDGELKHQGHSLTLFSLARIMDGDPFWITDLYVIASEDSLPNELAVFLKDHPAADHEEYVPLEE